MTGKRGSVKGGGAPTTKMTARKKKAAAGPNAAMCVYSVSFPAQKAQGVVERVHDRLPAGKYEGGWLTVLVVGHLKRGVA